MKEHERESGKAGPSGAPTSTVTNKNEVRHQPPPSVTFAHLRHEMRTPLNQIIGFSDLLIEDAEAASQTDLARDLRKINAAGKNLQKLIGDILDLASPGSATAEEIALRTALPEATELELGPETRLAVEPATLLIVDDEASNREILGRRLERQGHSVEVADSGEKALQMLGEKPFDLVLLDIMMPSMDGFEVLSRIKDDDALKHIPVIVVSALDDLESVVRCIEMGADDYLPKPFNTVLLQARVGASLEKKWLRDAERALHDELERNHGLLTEMQQIRDELTRLLVEDLQQPLTAFLAGIRSIPDMGPLNDEQRECLELAATSGEKLVNMVSDLV